MAKWQKQHVIYVQDHVIMDGAYYESVKRQYECCYHTIIDPIARTVTFRLRKEG